MSRKLIVNMAKQVIATVKTDKQIIIEGVNREKSILGSASEVCERALLAYFQSQKRHDFSVNDLDSNRFSLVRTNVNINDYTYLHEIASKNLMGVNDLACLILSKFCRAEILFYDTPENPETEPITPIIEAVNQEITPIIEAVNDNKETVIIKISELLIAEVADSLREKGFEELRYYTTKKEQQTNQQFSKLLQNIRNEHKEETDYLNLKIEGLETNDLDVKELIKGTKIVIDTLTAWRINPFTTYKKSDILGIFPEKLRPIFDK